MLFKSGLLSQTGWENMALTFSNCSKMVTLNGVYFSWNKVHKKHWTIIMAHWIRVLKGAPDPVARELYFQTEYCMNIIQIPHSRTL